MERTMKSLISLQDCDSRIMALRKRKADGPARINTLEEKLSSMDAHLQEEQAALQARKHERRQVEQDIDHRDAQVVKSNEKLSVIKSNKEYRAALKEIADLNREKALLEDRAIELMEGVEKLERRCASATADLERFKEEVDGTRAEIVEELAQLDTQLEGLEAERVRYSDVLDRDLLSQYERLRAHKNGCAVSAVIKGVCQACHLGIPPQKFNELIRGDVLMNCPHCMRIMFWGEDERYNRKGEEA